MAALRAVIRLTGREADELHTLLSMILTNDDQWTSMDLQALRRADDKITDAIRKAVNEQ